MEKKIEDYLHLYLGCECRFGVFVPNQETVFYGQFVDTRVIHNVLNNLAEVELLLRPLSDMTDTEIDELASVLLGKETHCFKKWRSEDGECIIAEWKKEKPQPPYDKEYDYMTMGMLISGNFSIKHKWDYHNNKGTGTTNEPLHNYQEVSRYLLSKHFDLFGLIESGLAIDKTTLTPENK